MSAAAATDELYHNKKSVAPLGIIAMPGAEQLAEKVNSYLVGWANENGFPDKSYLIECECPRFASGDGKGLIKSTIRGLDLFIVIDVGNYSIQYKMFDKVNCMSPDDHYQDLKRIIQAASGKAHRLNIIMPLLYGGRQHRRNYRESLDCACALQELQAMGVDNIITFDAHDPRVNNAVPLMGIDNVIPSYQVLKTMLKTFPDLDMSPEKFMVISPDEGALGRNMYYATMLGVNLGMFYKRRDFPAWWTAKTRSSHMSISAIRWTARPSLLRMTSSHPAAQCSISRRISKTAAHPAPLPMQPTACSHTALRNLMRHMKTVCSMRSSVPV